MRKQSRRDTEFGEYVAGRRPHLYRVAWLLCGDPHLAEDLVQQTLTKLYLSWHRVTREGSLDAYSRQILVNAHLDEVRRPHRRRERVAEQQDLDRPSTPRLGVEESDALRRALQDLAPGQRAVVVLRHYWGLSVDETADTLGITPGTVKSQTSDALKRLRGVLVGSDPRGTQG